MDVNFDAPQDHGVYVIWNKKHYIYVGQGIIAIRLREHRNDPAIRKRQRGGYLSVTWAIVSSAHDRNGIERFLVDRLHPVEGGNHSDVVPISVNVPM